MIPVKRLDEAKSRLRPDVADVPALALAFAVDTIAAAVDATRVGRVIVVTVDPLVGPAATALGAMVVPDPGGGLNPAASAGVAAAPVGPVAVLAGDLPSIRPGDLDEALALADDAPLSMVADHSGEGTTLLAAATGSSMHPRFGPGSRGRHEGAGHTVLGIAKSSPLRWDVDTADDLAIVLTVGVGAATAAIVSDRVLGSAG